jgi:hypothetical protein
MGRREKRLRRIERLRVKERRLEGAVRLGADGLKQDLTETQKHIGALIQAMTKRPAPFKLAEHHPMHVHPNGDLNRGLGAVRRILVVACGLYGEECLDAIEDAEHELYVLIERDARAKKLSAFVDEMCGLLTWTHVKDASDRAMHFREQRGIRRRHTKLKRKTSTVRPYKTAWRFRHMHRPGPGYRTLYLLGATKPCRCWLCKNARLFNTKTGKHR